MKAARGVSDVFAPQLAQAGSTLLVVPSPQQPNRQTLVRKFHSDSRLFRFSRYLKEV